MLKATASSSGMISEGDGRRIGHSAKAHADLTLLPSKPIIPASMTNEASVFVQMARNKYVSSGTMVNAVIDFNSNECLQ